MYKASQTLLTWKYATRSLLKFRNALHKKAVYDCAKYVSRRLDRNPIKVYDKSLRS